MLEENQQYDVLYLPMDNYLFAYQLPTIRAIIKNNHVVLYHQSIHFN